MSCCKPNPISRRALLSSATAALGASLANVFAVDSRPQRILLRSSWQTMNIGDIGHTPGVLALLEKYLPATEVTLWPSSVRDGVEEMLLARFRRLKIVDGSESLQQAFTECDFLLHGSGASLVAQRHVAEWIKATGKPFGIYGISFAPQKSWQTAPLSEENIAASIEVLNQAQFVYFRDSVSMEFAKSKGCSAPVAAFGPDGAFACDLRNDAPAIEFLKQNALAPGKFLCCIPRMRYTPSWMVPEKNRPIDPIKDARNQAMKEHDHAPLRQAIIDVTLQTDMKVLLCPEDKTQMKISKDLLYDPLPQSVKEKVVWRSKYWLTDEAISTYVRSAGLFGNELHSAIMCIGHGIPAIICRWAEQTSKGTMWHDIGLSDWLFDLDDEQQLQQVAATVLSIAQDPIAAKRKADTARVTVAQHQRRTMLQLNQELTDIAPSN